MSVIYKAIPPQSFELVRDRIGQILAIEIETQALLTYDSALELSPGKNSESGVWVERFVPFDKTEVPCVNVSLMRGDPIGQSMIHVDGFYRYAIDCYHNAKSSDGARGDVKATKKLQRLMGVVRAILEDPAYKTLGYSTPFIGARHVEGITVGEPEDRKEATSLVVGRIVFTVRVPEGVRLNDPLLLAEHETTVNLGETDNGYVYTYQHP